MIRNEFIDKKYIEFYVVVSLTAIKKLRMLIKYGRKLLWSNIILVLVMLFLLILVWANFSIVKLWPVFKIFNNRIIEAYFEIDMLGKELLKIV